MDKIFKIGLLVLGFGYLTYLFGVGANIDTVNAQDTNQVGRYQLNRDGIPAIIDTKTADLYMLLDMKWKFTNPIKSESF